ncbi:Uu.00g019740.m01.CDS01 [Anthostomella pinea]|uniref:Uu.00g019740.m01.CDS01 n=1 Tax=Anthostomella pinea TaxID=933095 RepID=A0AAI8VZW5_9PEZI|nr:Uu.00g019740.m01.CDS01 [Anthostomella pinea]
MEQAQLEPSVRLPWEKPNPPKRRPTFSKRPSMGTRMPSVAMSIEQRRVRLLNFLPLNVKNHIVAVASEFAGTFMFLLFAFGGTNAVNTAPDEGQPQNLAANPSKLMFISLCFGMSLAVNAWVFFRISGGLFNPAVTLGMMIIGAVGYLRGVLIVISQIAGGIAAAAVISGIQPGDLKIATSLGGGTSVVQGLFTEMFLTAQLVFTIFMLAAEKHRATFIAPIGIGLSLFIAELMGVYFTGGSLNPARSFGPDVIAGHFESYHWIYWVGPILGSLLASAFYVTIKALEYETVNIGQDHPGESDELSRTGTNTTANTVANSKVGRDRTDTYEHPDLQRVASSTAGPAVRIDTGEGQGTSERGEKAGGRGPYFGGPDMEAGRG